MAVTPGGGRELVCGSCGGRVIGLAPFERAMASGVGTSVWMASAAGAAGGGFCPYCRQPMHTPDAMADAASAGISVCRLCQEIWLPAGAAAWVGAHASTGVDSQELAAVLSGRTAGTGGAAGSPVATECTNCGAPWEPNADGRCPYCRAQLTAPQPVVMVWEHEEPAPGWGSELFRLL